MQDHGRIKAFVAERHVQRAALHEPDSVGHSHPLRQAGRDIDIALRQIDAGDIGADIVGGKAGWATHAGTNVEQPGPRLQPHLADEFPGGGDAANVELVDRFEIAGAQMGNVHAGIGEHGKNVLLKTRYVVVTGDARSHRGHDLYPCVRPC